MGDYSYIEYGVICDRTQWGLGKILVATGRKPESAWNAAHFHRCFMKAEHSHTLNRRVVTMTDWYESLDETGVKEAQIVSGERP